MLIVFHYVLMLHHYILMLLYYILYDTLSYKKMEIFEPDWLHIKIYIAKTRASAIQVKLESGRNVSRSPLLHCWISLCQTTPISPAYCSSLFRRLGILQVSFCHLLILFDPASGRLQMAIFFTQLLVLVLLSH